jgi:nucleotide-binding universal stress UspA family protein
VSVAAPVSDERPENLRYGRILLASEGRPIPQAAIDRVVELADPDGANVHVFSIARVHGTAFGMPTPGLLPTKREWAEQRELVDAAIKRLKRKGIKAGGHVLGTRNATKKILAEAAKEGCEAIVMAADPDRNRVTGNLMWSQEPQRVRRRAKLPVFLVADEADEPARRAGTSAGRAGERPRRGRRS